MQKNKKQTKRNLSERTEKNFKVILNVSEEDKDTGKKSKCKNHLRIIWKKKDETKRNEKKTNPKRISFNNGELYFLPNQIIETALVDMSAFLTGGPIRCSLPTFSAWRLPFWNLA